MDELSTMDSTHSVDDAEIILRNYMLGYDDKRWTKANGKLILLKLIKLLKFPEKKFLFTVKILKMNH